MSKYSVSVWFEVEADSIDDAWDVAAQIGDLVKECQDFDCVDSDSINVEELE